MSDAALKAVREAMVPPWLRKIDLNKISQLTHEEAVTALVEVITVVDFAKRRMTQDDWEYVHKTICEAIKQPEAM